MININGWLIETSFFNDVLCFEKIHINAGNCILKKSRKCSRTRIKIDYDVNSVLIFSWLKTFASIITNASSVPTSNCDQTFHNKITNDAQTRDVWQTVRKILRIISISVLYPRKICYSQACGTNQCMYLKKKKGPYRKSKGIAFNRMCLLFSSGIIACAWGDRFTRCEANFSALTWVLFDYIIRMWGVWVSGWNL